MMLNSISELKKIWTKTYFIKIVQNHNGLKFDIQNLVYVGMLLQNWAIKSMEI